MTTEVEMSRMSWTDYAEAIATRDPAVLIPVGSVEQHGPHLPLATDCLIPEAIAKAAARQTGAIVAPTISYGYKSVPRCGGGQHFCGTTSVDAATLIGQLKDIVRELARHKVTKVSFVVGHMENLWFVTEACDLALREVKMLGLVAPRLMNVGYWEFLSKPTIEKAFDGTFPDWSLEHAGIMETSIMLHCHPELVKMERLIEHGPATLPVYDLWPYDTAQVPDTGVLNTAKGASADKGKLFYDEYVQSFSEALIDAFGKSPRVR